MLMVLCEYAGERGVDGRGIRVWGVGQVSCACTGESGRHEMREHRKANGELPGENSAF